MKRTMEIVLKTPAPSERNQCGSSNWSPGTDRPCNRSFGVAVKELDLSFHASDIYNLNVNIGCLNYGNFL